MNKLFLHKLIIILPSSGINLNVMIRRFILIFLFFTCACFLNKATAQVRDTVTIVMPPYTDTTCDSVQLTFAALQSSDTFSDVTFQWYVDDTLFTGVTIDTFLTTALHDGDSVFCRIFFTNSFGLPDESQSNTIIVHRSSSIPPGIVISLTTGSNPDCAGHPLIFTAYPVNGGPSPQYQWMIDGVPVAGADSTTFTRVFGDPDTISCRIISNSPCASPYPDTVISNLIPIIHYHLTDSINITVSHNPICSGSHDTLTATYYNPGMGFTLSWFVNGVYIPGVIGNTYYTDSLRNGDNVYCVLNTPDPCIATDSAVSNYITMTVISLAPTSVSVTMIHGSNPGCIDSPVTFQGTYSNFGVNPVYNWYINGALVASDTSVFDTTYTNGEILTFQAYATDTGCYSMDTVASAGILMLRDSTPPYPWISLIVNQLVTNSGGSYEWYYSMDSTGPFTLYPGLTTQVIHPPLLGYWYAVKDSTTNCYSLPSNILYIALLAVPTVNSSENIKISPNPTTGILDIDFGTQAVNMKMDIYSILGQGLRHEDIDNKTHYETDLSYLPDGDYILALRSPDGSVNTYKIQLSK
jgi:hypothetical protein